jgi:branched-chain amino acid transport system permease protein
MAKFVQALVAGIGTGGVYALVAYGITLVYSVTRTVNLAHGDVVMTAVFVSLTGLLYGLPAWESLVLGVVAAAAIGALLERVVLAPLAGRRDPLSWFLALVLFAAVLRGGATLVFGDRAYPLPVSLGGEDVVRIGSVAFRATYLYVMGLAVALAAGLHLLLRRSAFGRAVRTIAESPDSASLAGVNVPRVRLLTFVLASTTGAVAGLVFAPLTFVSTQLGFLFTFKGFVAATIGGLGSGAGALAGGLLVGVLESLLLVTFDDLSAGGVDAIVFAVAIVVLVLAPQGIAGRRERNR